MKKVILKLFILMNMLMMSMVVMPTSAFAADGVPYLDAAGVEQIAPTAIEITSATNTLTSGWYVVNANVTKAETITVTGDVHLILMDNFTLEVEGSDKNAGIHVAESNKLTIYAQSTDEATMGKIVSESGYIVYNGYWSSYGAGIGGNEDENGGHITINGGHITAKGYDSSAGIGGGYKGGAGTIIINGGIVKSSSLERGIAIPHGAGIGSGQYGADGGSITINGGNVYASATYGAGIGGGYEAVVDNITINGGIVTAKSRQGAGIGGGYGDDGGNITINGGTITAISAGWMPNSNLFSYGSGAGIGSGASSNSRQTNAGNIIITGGVVNAKANYGGAGIGGGAWSSYLELLRYKGGNGGNIKISGGTITATGTFGGAGIGGGVGGNGAEVTISGGTVSAESIEGEDYVPVGDFTWGAYSAKDIGGGYDASSDGSLTISGTSAVFLRKDLSALVTTSTHGHQVFSAATEVTEYTVPTSWDSEFGAWLPLALSTVEFDSAGGSEVPSITQEQGTIITPPADPTREGYTFDGWDPVLPETMPVEGLVLKAKWKANETEPGEEEPTDPKEEEPTDPGEGNPGDSGEEATDPKEEPGIVIPSNPEEEKPTQPGNGEVVKPDENETIEPDTNKPTDSGEVEAEDDKTSDKLPDTGDENVYSLAGFILLLIAVGLNILLKWDEVKKEQ